MNIRTIIADRHEIFRQGLQSLLQAAGISSIAQAANGVDAWNLIEELQPDVALLEICMPQLSGIDVVRNVVIAGHATQVIILTSCEDPVVAMAAQQAGAAGYVLKSSSIESLVKAVQTVVAGGTFTTPGIREKIRNFHRQGKKFIALSPREQEVLRLIAAGNSGKQIARLMDVSPRTVDTYRDRIMRKTEAHNLSDIVRFAVRAGMIE